MDRLGEAIGALRHFVDPGLKRVVGVELLHEEFDMPDQDRKGLIQFVGRHPGRFDREMKSLCSASLVLLRRRDILKSEKSQSFVGHEEGRCGDLDRETSPAVVPKNGDLMILLAHTTAMAEACGHEGSENPAAGPDPEATFCRFNGLADETGPGSIEEGFPSFVDPPDGPCLVDKKNGDGKVIKSCHQRVFAVPGV